MSILKTDLIVSDSPRSWEDAANNAVRRATKTVRNVRSVDVDKFSAVVADGEVQAWRVSLQITFEVDEPTLEKVAAVRARIAKARKAAPRKAPRRAPQLA